MVVSIRGVYIRPDPEKRLDKAAQDLVESALIDGRSIRLSAHDLVKMARGGGFQLPKHLDVNDTLQLYGYCSGVLYHLTPNHGSVKREKMGASMTYEFLPDVPDRGVVKI